MGTKLQIASWLMIHVPLLLMVAAALLVKAGMADDDRLELVGIVGATVALVCLVVALVLAAKVDCPVCFGRIFGSARCSRHREARRVMGSTRLGMVVQAVFGCDDLRCRFCGTRLHVHEEEESVEEPKWNEIDELHSLQVRTRRRTGRQVRSVGARVPERRSRVRSRRGGVSVGRSRSGVERVKR